MSGPEVPLLPLLAALALRLSRFPLWRGLLLVAIRLARAGRGCGLVLEREGQPQVPAGPYADDPIGEVEPAGGLYGKSIASRGEL